MYKGREGVWFPPILLLLLTFLSHVIQLLLGNLGRAPRSLENTGQTPAKVTLAELGFLG